MRTRDEIMAALECTVCKGTGSAWPEPGICAPCCGEGYRETPEDAYVRLARVLDALREPSAAILRAARLAHYSQGSRPSDARMPRALAAALDAAQREAGATSDAGARP